MNKKVKCPECKSEIEVDSSVSVGDIEQCLNCDIELKVVSVIPLKLEIMTCNFSDDDEMDEDDEENMD
ncbi:MAG: hypothetical protein HY810_01145 [Candidatus Omnitrophica bacterium]|nr:hypothetical protein [Candidatus Omnitrophota bacterium]